MTAEFLAYRGSCLQDVLQCNLKLVQKLMGLLPNEVAYFYFGASYPRHTITWNIIFYSRCETDEKDNLKKKRNIVRTLSFMHDIYI